MTKNQAEQWDAFILWCLKLPHERGGIDTETAWAEKHGVSTRTLRRWKTLPEFQARKEVLEASKITSKPDVTDVTLGADESDYQIVKAALVEGAFTIW